MPPDLLTTVLVALLAAGAVAAFFTARAKRRENAQQSQVTELASARDVAVANAESLESARGQLQRELDSAREQIASLSAELAASKARTEEREQGLREQLSQFESTKQALRLEFENLSREFLSARDKELRAHNKESIGALLTPLSEKIEGFQHRVNQVHGDFVKNSSELHQQIQNLEKLGLAMSTDATQLTQALKGDKKLVGNWGEAQLERTLEMAGLRADEHYETQASFKDASGQRYLPDVVIHLPDGKHLVIDSKVSLVDYEAAIAAESEEARAAALTRHAAAVRNHIKSLAGKDYSNLPGLDSPDFVLMFMPVEPAYLEIMKHNRDLFSEGYQQGVVLVSHTTLMPILRTVSNLWMMEQSNAEARAISDRAGDVFNSVCLVARRLEDLGSSLQTANRKYNETVTAMAGQQGLHGKVGKFRQLSQRANKTFPENLGPLSEDNDQHRLGVVGTPADED